MAAQHIYFTTKETFPSIHISTKKSTFFLCNIPSCNSFIYVI